MDEGSGPGAFGPFAGRDVGRHRPTDVARGRRRERTDGVSFLTWLTSRRKSLTSMTAQELRAREMLLNSERDRLAARIARLSADKQQLIERGAQEKTPELRRTLAQQFDLLHTEQMMLARQLNVRTKEALTVSRLRLLRENARQAGAGGGAGLRIREADLALIERLIESDQIGSEVYQERLDAILRIGQQADQGEAAISPAAQELLRIWSDMDAGVIRDARQACDEAERRLRERQEAGEA